MNLITKSSIIHIWQTSYHPLLREKKSKSPGEMDSFDWKKVYINKKAMLTEQGRLY